jgi:hypothetical protein
MTVSPNVVPQPICGPCSRDRADAVRHADPCEESVYSIRKDRVQAGLADLQEDLRACITEARATNRVNAAQLLAEVLTNIEQESRAVLLIGDGFSLAAREGVGEAEGVPSHFLEGTQETA